MNFNEALVEATRLARAQLPNLQESVFLVRDLHGRIRILLKKRREVNSPYFPPVQALISDVSGRLGPYAYPADDLIMYRDELKNLNLPGDTTAAVLDSDGTYKVCLHDRLLMGADWSARPPAQAPHPTRFTLYSMKGGVGRSTTAVVLAHHLAQKGKRVLIFDLDLESPGVGSTLLGAALPAFGIVDWFVEDALGQGAHVLPNMVQDSPLPAGPGSIKVVPAFGVNSESYLAKLGRAYLERGPAGPEPWPSRVRRLVEALEAQETPDIVLLDSRTGLHDTSAALVLAMGADTLMFTVDTPQTWRDYRILFEHWMGHPDLARFYNKLWLLGAMVPETGRETYLESASDEAWTLYSETLYGASQLAALPNFTVPLAGDQSAGHYPRPIFWNPTLMGFDPLASWTPDEVQRSYGMFLRWFDAVFLGELEEADPT